jgi:hypothetical protein
MNDDDILSLVRDRMARARDDLGAVRMEEPVSAVFRRARSRRLRHRLYGAAAGTGALAVALAVGAGAAGAGGGTATGVAGGSPSAGAAAGAGHADLDAWSVSTAADGTVVLTVRQLADKAELEKALAAAGIPAVVIFGGTCGGAGDASAGAIGKVLGTRDVSGAGGDEATASRGGGVTLNPAAVPSGDDVSIGISYGPSGKEPGTFDISLGLIPRGTALTCSDSAKFGPAK